MSVRLNRLVLVLTLLIMLGYPTLRAWCGNQPGVSLELHGPPTLLVQRVCW